MEEKKQKYILVVDDEVETLKALRSALEKQGYKVRSAETGRSAIDTFMESCHEEPFDLVLLDIGLPDMSGIDVLRIIRQEEELRGLKYQNGIKIIIQTGDKESWTESFNRGCDDFILKPYSFNEFLKIIKEKLEG